MFNNRSKTIPNSRIVGGSNVRRKTNITGGSISFNQVAKFAQDYVIPIAKKALESDTGKAVTKQVIEKVAKKVTEEAEKKFGPNEERNQGIKQATKIVQDKIDPKDDKILNDIMKKGISPKRLNKKKPIINDQKVQEFIGRGLNITE